MVVVSPEALPNTGQLNMNSTCALGPTSRHTLFGGGGGIVGIDAWHQHQMKEEHIQIHEDRERNSSPMADNKATNSPTYSNCSSGSVGCDLNTSAAAPSSPTNNLYNHIHQQIINNNSIMHQRHQQLLIKQESNNNNEDNTETDINHQSVDKSQQGNGSEDSQSSTCSTNGSDAGSLVRPASMGSAYIDNGASNDASLDDPLRRLQMALQRTGMMGTSPPPQSILANTSVSPIMSGHNAEKPLQCPICTFSTTSRTNFNTHLQSHEDQRACSMCEFTAESMDQFREHMRDVHDVALSGNTEDDGLEDDEPGLAIPKINSQGKVKTFRCKQCDFSAVTKLEFWEHTRGHIKQERLLTCPRCPFVTEYKHHLEYHLRNHFGSKPFKCDKCSYSCVNKSMLNSHLKSHSNIYQYRCADCTYATKYCHSLKLHLRKYGHSPAMVLNPDGSPNPLPIVDVYGTRRGPKQRLGKGGVGHSPEDANTHSPSHQASVNPPTAGIHPLFASPYGIPYYSPLLHPLMYGGKPLLAQHDASNTMDAQQQQQMLQDVKCDNTLYNINNNHISINENTGSEQYSQEMERSGHSPAGGEVEGPIITEVAKDQTYRGTPLDLSRSEAQENLSETINVDHDSSKAHQVESCDSKQTIGRGVQNVGRNLERRRKGKAFKLDRIALRLQQQTPSSGEDDGDVDAEAPPLKRQHVDDEAVSNSNNSEDEELPLPLQCVLDEDNKSGTVSPQPLAKKAPERKSPPNTTTYNCAYCDIMFKDVIMYTMHMGYHGFQDPYTCNMCGQQTSDKVSFFLHIARTSHS